jgi:hypothetical protein
MVEKHITLYQPACEKLKSFVPRPYHSGIFVERTIWPLQQRYEVVAVSGEDDHLRTVANKQQRTVNSNAA